MTSSQPQRRSRRLRGLAPEPVIPPVRRRALRGQSQPAMPQSKKLDRFYFDSVLEAPELEIKPCSYWVTSMHCLLAFLIVRLLQRRILGTSTVSKATSSHWTEKLFSLLEIVNEGTGEPACEESEESDQFFFDAVEELMDTEDPAEAIEPAAQAAQEDDLVYAIDDCQRGLEIQQSYLHTKPEPSFFHVETERAEVIEPAAQEEDGYDVFDEREPAMDQSFLTTKPAAEEDDVFVERGPSIHETKLATNQNRNPSSENGCSCISALVAAYHLQSDLPFVPDEAVEDVIDRVCGPILQAIRSKLGYVDRSFLIPSDTHDHLLEMGLLPQRYFEGVIGGDVTDNTHMEEYLRILSVGEDGKGAYRKAASTFFFHSHVISITKVVLDDEVSYDVFDSLPGTRTQCEDLDALRAHLQNYTAGDYSELETFNEWLVECNGDPRLFQGFVWHVK